MNACICKYKVRVAHTITIPNNVFPPFFGLPLTLSFRRRRRRIHNYSVLRMRSRRQTNFAKLFSQASFWKRSAVGWSVLIPEYVCTYVFCVRRRTQTTEEDVLNFAYLFQVRWYRDTMLLAQNENRMMKAYGVRHSLLIHRASRQDFGNYSCAAENKLGRSRAFIEVSGKFFLPIRPKITKKAANNFLFFYGEGEKTFLFRPENQIKPPLLPRFFSS